MSLPDFTNEQSPELSEELTEKAEQLQEFLKGVHDPILGKVLCEDFGINRQQLCTIVNYLRREGYRIGSGQKGYFWCVTEEEIDSTIHHLVCRIQGAQAALEGLYAAKETMQQEEGLQLTCVLDHRAFWAGGE